MNSVAITLLTILLTTSTGTYAVVETAESMPKEKSLPPVSVYASWLNEDRQQQCESFNSEGGHERSCLEDALDPQLIFDGLTISDKFENIVLSQEGLDYELLLANAAFKHSDARIELVGQMQVTWRGVPLGDFEYALPFDPTRAQPERYAYDIVRRFLLDVQKEQTFDPVFLYQKLQASDYPTDLKAPDEVAGFTLRGKQLFADPFQGVMLRYTHPHYEDDHFDMFVYPIFHSHWNDAQLVMRDELGKELNDILTLAEARSMDIVGDSAVEPIMWDDERQSFSGYSVSVNATNNEDQPIYASTYVFIAKDKIIKFSANFPRRLADVLVKEALPHVDVPGESALMQGIRKHAG